MDKAVTLRQIFVEQQHFFGMTAHIGVDVESGLAHTVTTTAANLLNAGARIDGSTAATGRAEGSGSMNVMEACASCKLASEYLRVMTVNP